MLLDRENCRVFVDAGAELGTYLRTILAGIVPQIAVNDSAMSHQKRPPSVGTGTAVAAVLLRWVSVAGHQVAVQSGNGSRKHGLE